MKLNELLEYCLNKEGAYVDFPFGSDYITVKIKNGSKSKIFAEIFTLNSELKFTFSTDELTADFLRNTNPDVIVKGWHCPPVQAKYKSTATVDDLPNDLLLQLVDISYEMAISKLGIK